MSEFKMPSLGADMEAGTLVAWHKQPGDRVARGEVIAEVETDKGIIEIEAFATGVLERLVVPEGEKVPVGTVLAIIQDEGATAASAPAQIAAPASEPVTEGNVTSSPAVEHLSAERLAMSPSARRLARELKVDPTNIQGTGPHGAITREDVQRAAKASMVRPPQPTATPVETGAADRAVRMRQAISAAVSRSKREIPHYYLYHTIDFQRAWDWIEAQNLGRPITERLLYGVLLVKAVALGLREVPELNSVVQDNAFVQKQDIHIGIAISLRGGGLIAPALHDVDHKPVTQLMEELRDLVNRARSGGLRGSELSDPTITLTSLGELGVEAVFGVIYPPQTAIVGLGKILQRPWVVDGKVVPRRLITATLSADHRVSDGHRGARFLASVDRLLQEPEKL